MAFLSGIFGSAQPPAAPAAPAAPTVNSNGSAGPAGQQQQPANPAANPAAMPGTPAPTAAGGPQPPSNPLDQFTTLFQPKTPANANTQADANVLAPLDPAAFRQQVANANFASGIPQETIQKAISGDAGAFAEAINHAAREAFAAAAQLSHGLVEHGVRAGTERLSGSLDSRIRNYQVRSQNTGNEALSHPAVAPMLNAVKMQIATANPTLSPDQVQNQAEQYFTQMSEVLMAPKMQQQQQQKAPKGQDFSYLLAD